MLRLPVCQETTLCSFLRGSGHSPGVDDPNTTARPWRSCPDPEPPSPDLFPEPILDLSHRMYSHLQILRRLPIPDHLNCRPKIRVHPSDNEL